MDAYLAVASNRRGQRGTADEVLAGADVLLGLSGPGAVSAAGVRGRCIPAIAIPTWHLAVTPPASRLELVLEPRESLRRRFRRGRNSTLTRV